MSTDSIDFVRHLLEQSVSNFDWAKDLIQGCSVSEVDEILSAQQVSFVPDLYKQFMLAMGKSSIVFERNGFYAYPNVLKFKTQTISFLEFWRNINNHNIFLPDDAFVLYEAEDSAFYYFHTNDHVEDPMLFCIWENDAPIFLETNQSLSGFLQNGLNLSISEYKCREQYCPEMLPPRR